MRIYPNLGESNCAKSPKALRLCLRTPFAIPFSKLGIGVPRLTFMDFYSSE